MLLWEASSRKSRGKLASADQNFIPGQLLPALQGSQGQGVGLFGVFSFPAPFLSLTSVTSKRQNDLEALGSREEVPHQPSLRLKSALYSHLSTLACGFFGSLGVGLGLYLLVQAQLPFVKNCQGGVQLTGICLYP